MKCCWCQKEQIRTLTIKELLWLPAIKETLCVACQNKIKPITKPHCPTCCRLGKREQCRECQQWKKRYPTYDFQHEALFSYEEGFKEWIHEFKFMGNYRLKNCFSTEIANYFSKKEALVCPIPLSKERLETRGFNQVEVMLEAANVPMVHLLSKPYHFEAQSEKDREQRLAMPQPFKVNENVSQIKGKSIILVDDVYTTGRTLFHAAQLLLPYEPAKITTFSYAR